MSKVKNSIKKKESSSAKKAIQKKQPQLQDSDYDEMDHFHKKKDQILFAEQGDDSGSEDEFGQVDTLMDLPEAKSEGEEEMVEGEFGEMDDEALFAMDGGDGEERDADHDWGKGRKNYYSADSAKLDKKKGKKKGKKNGKNEEVSLEEVAEEEAKEAQRLYKKKLSAMKPEDFGVSQMKADSQRVQVKSVSFSDDEEEDSVIVGEQEGAEKFEEISGDFEAALEQVKTVLQPLMEKVSAGQLPRSQGLSFLQTKYNLLLHYCINVLYYVKQRGQGRELEGGVLEKLVKYRMLMERIKPLEAKLKPQIDRLLKAAAEEPSTAVMAESRPRPELQLPAEEGDLGGSGKYVVPKIKAMLMPEEAARREGAEKSRSRIQHELARDSRSLAEGDNLPEEEDVDPIRRMGDMKRKAGRGAAQVEAFEEDNFVRFQLGKKEKHRLVEESKLVDGLDDLNDMFDEFDRSAKHHANEEVVAVKESIKSSKSNKRAAKESESEIESGSEEDYYQQVKKAKQSKHEKEPPHQKQVRYRALQDTQPGKARPASRPILTNRGLTPHRPKDAKNPRLKQRSRYERASKKLSSFKSVAGDKPKGQYGGEATGIRTNLSRSVKF